MGKIGLIVEREFMQRVRKRSFLIVTFLTPLAMVAMMIIPMLIAKYGSDSQQRQIVVIDPTAVVSAGLKNVDNIIFTVDSTTNITHQEALGAHSSAFGVLEVGSDIVENPAALKLYTRQSSTLGIEKEIKNQVSDIVTSRRIADSGVAGLDSLIQCVKARASIQTFEVDEQASADGQKSSVAEKSSTVSMGVAYGASLLIYMFVLIYGMMVLQGVVEEKSSRIIEVIVSSVRPFELMMGKILGIASVALLQFFLWIIVGVGLLFLLPSLDPDMAASMAGGMGGAPAAGAVGSSSLGMLFDPWFLTKVIGGFIIFFVGGYLLYAAMFAAVGSAVDNVGDTQQLQLPITMPLIISIFIMVSVMQDPYSSAAFWFSIIPFTSPIIMMARIPYGVPLWEFALSVVVLYGSFVAMTYLAAKIYRTGIFMYGKKPSLMEIIRWARYKN
ncbi:MAG: ABC transporter permease [Mucinivorans sp.]